MVKTITQTLAEIETWEEVCHKKALKIGLTDPDEIAEYLDEKDGDQSDDWLLDRNHELEQLIGRAREELSISVGEPEADETPSP